MRRATVDDADLVNELVAKQGQGGDFVDFLAEKANVCFITGDGGALFAWRGPGIYEIHLFLEQRGRDALEVLEAMLQRMREEFDAHLFWAAIPIGSRNVILFARLMGFKSNGIKELRHGACEIFSREAAPCRPS